MATSLYGTLTLTLTLTLAQLVLGLADGNFAVWDLRSNETFISRNHFPGKHKHPITCGAWGKEGRILALGSVNSLKVS